MTPRKAAGMALAASFSVYLIPLVGPHAAFLLGEELLRGGRAPRWLAMNVGTALAVQLAAVVLYWWFFRKAGWLRAIPLVLAFGVAVVTLSGVYLVAIPAMFLEEPDVASENVSWPVVCTVPDVEQTRFATSTELWVRYSQRPNQYAVLTMPGCRLTPLTLPEPQPGFTMDVTSVIPGGRAVVQRWEMAKGKASWWIAPGFAQEIGPGSTSPPLLSTDGRWSAWLDKNRVVLVSDSVKRVVDLGLGSYVLMGIDPEAQEMRLWQTDHLIVVGFDGKVRKEYPRSSATRPQSNTFIERGEHWLAWDAYREQGAYVVEWSLPAGAGTQRLPLGRTIHSAAIDGDGAFVAVSAGTGLNIGNARDAVWVFRAADGREVFRKYLPRYSRSPVAFLDGGYFAYSDPGGVHVLQAP